MLKELALSAAIAAGLGASAVLADQGQSTNHKHQRMSQVSQDPTKRFIEESYSSNQLEIELGQKVSQQAKDPQIKQLAQMIVKDHQQANQQVQQTAKQLNISLSQKMTPVDRVAFNHLSRLPADQFEREWVFFQAGEHQKNLLKNEYEAKYGRNEQVKQLASAQAKAIQSHLDHVQQVAQAQIGGTSPAMMGQMPGREDKSQEKQDYYQKQNQSK